MPLSCSKPPEPSSRHFTYSRKQKSLGLLCTNFLNLYNRDGIDEIGVDDAALKLGVERRRIYDIVNVLESVGVLARRGKNKYSWKGFGAIPDALNQLKEGGLRENFNALDKHIDNSVKAAFVDNDDDDDDDDADEVTEDDDSDSNANTGSQNGNSIPSANVKCTAASRFDNRKEKSLGLLTQNFVKLFVCSNMNLISLDEAAKVLLGDGHNSPIMRTKVRRLYDIANVLSSMKLIEKTHTADTRKPAFRWLGLRRKSANALAPHESRKRIFGADITNTLFKRNKVDSSVDGDKMQKQTKAEDSQQGSRSYEFGPFAPVSLPQDENKITQVHDWESLASTHRPKYHNQALRDLFAHYMEAWQSWYTEVAGKKPIQQIS